VNLKCQFMDNLTNEIANEIDRKNGLAAELVGNFDKICLPLIMDI